MPLLGGLVKITGGGTPSRKESHYWDGSIPWATVKDFSGGSLDGALESITEEGIRNSATNLIPAGSIIIPTRMAVGKAAINTIDLALNQDLKALSIIDPKKVNRDYLFRFLLSKASYLSSRGKGATVKGITLDVLKELEIPLPPLDEQKRIAAILDKADAVRRKRQQAIELAEKFLQSVFLDMFGDPVTNPKGWEKKKLGKSCGIGSSSRVFVHEFTNTGIPFYRGTEIGKLSEGKSVIPHLFISEEHYVELTSKSGSPEKGDLLLPSICHDGKIWQVNTDRPFYFKDGRVLWIKTGRESIHSEYLRWHLRYLFLNNYNKFASGTTFAELKIVALKEIDILLPPLELQDKFGEIVTSYENLIEAFKREIVGLENLFNSLSQQAFKGQLTNKEAA